MTFDYYARPRLWLRGARQLLYPRRCPFCGEVLGSIPACSACAQERQTLRRTPDARLRPGQHYLGRLSGAAAPYRYAGCVRQGVLRAKYAAAPWAAAELGVWLAQLLFGAEVRMWGAELLPLPAPALGLEQDCIVPVPPSSRSRGYNVPTLLAAPLARALGLPLLPNALVRVRRGRRQAGLPLDERLANVAGAFRAPVPEAVEGKRVLLVDDVITTGATAAACAAALLDAGAMSVYAVALATVEWGADAPSPLPDEDAEDFFEKDLPNA